MSTFQPRYQNLVELIQRSVVRHGERPLFGVKNAGAWRWVTYAEFGRTVDEARGGLAALGVNAGDRVAVIANNRVEWAAGAYATYGLGAAYVPMYEAQQEKEWEFILHDCSAKVVLCANEEIAAKVGSMRAALPALTHVVSLGETGGDLTFTALREKGRASPCKSVSPAASDVAGYIYTSGTTGNPKGVLLTHGNLACNVSAALDVFPVNPDDRSLSFLPWAHSFGQTAELHTLVAVGASMGLCEGIPFIIPNLAEVRPTVLFAVPNVFNRIYDGVNKQLASRPPAVRKLFAAAMDAQTRMKNGQKVSLLDRLAVEAARRVIYRKIVERFGGRLKYAVSGGAALSRAVAEFVDNLGIMVFEGYGLTETSPSACVNTPEARRIGSVGKPLPGITVKLDHEASGSSDEGEIVIYGHNVMKGYYQLPDETAKVFTPDGGFRTGDLGRFDADGFLYITGRIKELYKLENGKYVAPAALESKLQLSPHILQAMVYGANRSANVAVLVPNFANLRDWARAQGITAQDDAALSRDARVRAHLRAEVDRQSTEFKGFESIKDFVIAHEEFSVANDMLTPKLSLKRRNVLKRYQPEIDALYAAMAKKN